jgi:hypothetical protein
LEKRGREAGKEGAIINSEMERRKRSEFLGAVEGRGKDIQLPVVEFVEMIESLWDNKDIYTAGIFCNNCEE